jgi:hypothetical protein
MTGDSPCLLGTSLGAESFYDLIFCIGFHQAISTACVMHTVGS